MQKKARSRFVQLLGQRFGNVRLEVAVRLGKTQHPAGGVVCIAKPCSGKLIGQSLQRRVLLRPVRVKTLGKNRQVFVGAVPFDQQEPVQRLIWCSLPYVRQPCDECGCQRLLPPMRTRHHRVARIHHAHRVALPLHGVDQQTGKAHQRRAAIQKNYFVFGVQIGTKQGFAAAVVMLQIQACHSRLKRLLQAANLHDLGCVTILGHGTMRVVTVSYNDAMSVRQTARAALCAADPAAKVAAVASLYEQMQQGTLQIHADVPAHTLAHAAAGPVPGRPPLPQLVPPAQVPRRSVHTLEGRAALLHAIVHIEFNAINLALDAVWRFSGMPEGFYRDWLRVAWEEASHFSMLHTHLQGMGWRYGDFAAHNGLWEMCEKTADDVTARMALVPRTLEARGLDATPLIQQRLRALPAAAADAHVTADLLDTILREEIGHVAIGNRWYRWLCRQQGIDPVRHYPLLVQRHAAPKLKPPLNTPARKQAGFTDEELAFLLGDGVNP